MSLHHDEGFAEGDSSCFNNYSVDEREELVKRLLSSLPLTRLARIQRWLTPLVQIDIVGLLPTELSLSILKQLSYDAILDCALVSRRWRVLANDPEVWRDLCAMEGWEWKEPIKYREFQLHSNEDDEDWGDLDDEGVGEDEDEQVEANMSEKTAMQELDSGFLSLTLDEDITSSSIRRSPSRLSVKRHRFRSKSRARHSAPCVLPSLGPLNKPNYKLLYQTRTLLRNRIKHSSARLITLQTKGTVNSHTSTIYCLQLYTFPGREGRQVLFTGSKDRTIRQWNLSNGTAERVFEGVHTGSVLSLCAHGQYVISGGSDHLIVVWDLESGNPVKILRDHTDSVLCVRFDTYRLVSCSKDRTVRTYLLPDFTPDLTFSHHRAAVNAVALSPNQIVSASGDRSIRLWDAASGDLIRTFEGHHNRGIASIDFSDNCILSGSSDRHLRLHDLTTDRGWSTCPSVESIPARSPSVCETCGSNIRRERKQSINNHSDLVRSVALGGDYVVSASYDTTIKVWDRQKGVLVADLIGGHSGRVFGVGFDCTKIVSCGEDQRICIWDFAHGLDTSFIRI